MTDAFQETLDKPGHMPGTIWVDPGSELYNGSIKSWLHDNSI